MCLILHSGWKILSSKAVVSLMLKDWMIVYVENVIIWGHP